MIIGLFTVFIDTYALRPWSSVYQNFLEIRNLKCIKLSRIELISSTLSLIDRWRRDCFRNRNGHYHDTRRHSRYFQSFFSLFTWTLFKMEAIDYYWQFYL